MIVPATLSVDPATRTLVITGPNTGGKTVLLKTIGLLTLMAQAGLHIPAKEGSALALFRQVLVDIGDEQSIAQNLSTFSGHLQHIVSFLRHADEHSLVLLDELGAGLTPLKGPPWASLSWNISTVGGANRCHHAPTAIKLHAHAHPAMNTAVMEFDAETLLPTFHVRVGHFGGSNAFAIGRRLGMPPEVLATAQMHIDADQHRLMEVADRLQGELRRSSSCAARSSVITTSRLRRVDTTRPKWRRSMRNDGSSWRMRLTSEVNCWQKHDGAWMRPSTRFVGKGLTPRWSQLGRWYGRLRPNLNR